MENFFNPKDVIVVGASDNPTKWGNWIAKDVLKHKRDIYFVNKSSQKVLDKSTYASIKDTPYGIALGIVCVESVEESVSELIDNGVLNIIVISAHETFSQNLIDKIKENSVYLLGPNCPGVWDSYSPFHCITMDLPVGNIGMVSQSGGVVMDLAHRLKPLKLGFSRVVTVGNNSAFNLELAIRSLEYDANTEVIALYFETEDVPYDYIRTIEKPVILLSPWATPAAIRAAKNHTGSDLKNVVNAARNMMEFVGALQFASSGMSLPKSRSTYIVTDTGGAGVLLATAAEFNALLVDEPTNEEFISSLKTVISKQTKVANPIDMIGESAGIGKSLFEVMKLLIDCQDIDCILVHIQGDDNPDAVKWAEEIADLVQKRDKPVFFSCYDYKNRGIQELLRRKIPVFREFEIMASIANMICGS